MYMNRFVAGDTESVIERLCATMNAIDKEWGEKIKPATKAQIQRLKDLIGFSENGIQIPKVYLDFIAFLITLVRSIFVSGYVKR